MQKDELRKLLEEKTKEYTAVREVVRYASPENPKPIATGAPPMLPKVNLREEEWRRFVAELENGTYAPDLCYQQAPRRHYGAKSRQGYATAKGGPQWRDTRDDGRGYKTKRS